MILYSAACDRSGLFALRQRGQHFLVFEDGLIERAAGLRVGREAVPDYLVAHEVPAFDVGMRAQNFIRHFAKVVVGRVRCAARLQLRPLAEILELLHGVGQGFVGVADHDRPQVPREIDHQQCRDDDCKQGRHEQPHLPTMCRYDLGKRGINITS